MSQQYLEYNSDRLISLEFLSFIWILMLLKMYIILITTSIVLQINLLQTLLWPSIFFYFENLSNILIVQDMWVVTQDLNDAFIKVNLVPHDEIWSHLWITHKKCMSKLSHQKVGLERSKSIFIWKSLTHCGFTGSTGYQRNFSFEPDGVGCPVFAKFVQYLKIFCDVFLSLSVTRPTLVGQFSLGIYINEQVSSHQQDCQTTI